MEDAAHKKGPEIVLGLVGAVGTDLELVSRFLSEALADLSYRCVPIQLSKLMHDLPLSPWKDLTDSSEYDRYDKHMTAGNQFREFLERGDALGLLAVGAIREARQERGGGPDQPLPRHAYILRSLKHPSEVKALRNIYGPSFFLVAAYCPREVRKRNLSQKLANSEYSLQPDQFYAKAETLMKRDESERDANEFGQNVRDTFPLADVFIDANDPDDTRASVKRFVELIFGTEIHTPSKDEYGMFHAQAAALRSAALGRQVGATITTVDGDIVAVGTNEVPKAGGGLYWSDDEPDKRDFRLGCEVSDKMKRRVLGDLIGRLKKQEWLADDKQDCTVEELVNQAFSDNPTAVMKGSQLVNSIEYFRAVHAEMAAIVDAARRGVAIRDGVLFTTTFPCHDCAKHIVAAGIQRVVFVEPYPKSLAPALYLDSIAVDQRRPESVQGGAAAVGYVNFESFVGVAPRQYMSLFVMGERKTKTGDVVVVNKGEAEPRFSKDLPPELLVLVKENQEFKRFDDQMRAKIALASAPQKNPQPAVVQTKKKEEVRGGA
jgi:cytidine deaminase